MYLALQMSRQYNFAMHVFLLICTCKGHALYKASNTSDGCTCTNNMSLRRKRRWYIFIRENFRFIPRIHKWYSNTTDLIAPKKSYFHASKEYAVAYNTDFIRRVFFSNNTIFLWLRRIYRAIEMHRKMVAFAPKLCHFDE